MYLKNIITSIIDLMLILKLTKYLSLCIYLLYYILYTPAKKQTKIESNHTNYHKSLCSWNSTNSTPHQPETIILKKQSSHRHRHRHRLRWQRRRPAADECELWICEYTTNKKHVIEHCKLSIETRSSLMRWYKLYRPSSMCYWCV